MRLPDPFRQARENPVPVLILFALFAIFWVLVPLDDLRDGVAHIRGSGIVSAATAPVRFWFIAAVMTAVEIFALCQIGVAADALLNRTKR
jgi:hypothetical protein